MSEQRITMVFLTTVVLFLLTLESVTGNIDKNALKLCVTSKSRIKDLSNQNLTHVPLNLPGDIEYLDVSHNSIPTLTEDVFSNHHQLCFLRMAHCGLTDIALRVFENTPLLKILNISHNRLAFIPDLSLRRLQILDLAYNLYESYRVPTSFRKLTNLEILKLGSSTAISVKYNDFDALQNVTLPHLFLGAGTKWKAYESGALAKLRRLQKISLKATFCGNFELFESILEDLNQTEVTAMRFVTVFPNNCNISGDPFQGLRRMPQIKNVTMENTWFNSSFMEVFMKNVWLSSIRDLSFVNITYNEDTPDGFQLPSLNHTVAVELVTFNGINHYQYRYPRFNVSFDLISRLTYMKFSRTGMNILPCNLIAVLPSLETLDVSNNLLTENGFWWPACSYTSVFPKLKQLFLSKNRFQSLSFIAKHTHQMKTLESLDLSFNSIILDGVTDWPVQLKELNLGNNFLGNDVFNFLSPHFERIDLSKTGLTAVTQEDISKFPKLMHLVLSSNSIQFIPANLKALSLLSLYIDQNAIASIFKEALSGIPNLQTLKAGNNPFVCSCDSYWFVTSLNKSLLPDWPLQYTCSTPAAFAGKSLTDLKGLNELSCSTWLQAIAGLSVVFTVSIVSGAVFYKCDGVWYTKMLWVWIRMKRRGQKRSGMLQDAAFMYHAFISYSHRDSDWVDSQLVTCLEDAGFNLCVHERDFVPGDWIIDNIVNCVESSYKTIFVLSEHFVQSEWCNYELFFAQHRAVSIQQDSMVFILLEPIPAESLPKKFLRLRSLLRQQTYLEWPQDERKRQVFWASLKSMLRGADKFMVLKNVALAISENVPLINSEERD